MRINKTPLAILITALLVRLKRLMFRFSPSTLRLLRVPNTLRLHETASHVLALKKGAPISVLQVLSDYTRYRYMEPEG